MPVIFRLFCLTLLLAMSFRTLLAQDISRMNRNELRDLAVHLQKLNDEYNSKILVLLETESALKQNVEALRTNTRVQQEQITNLNTQILNQQRDINSMTNELNRIRLDVIQYRSQADTLTKNNILLQEQFKALQDSIRMASAASQTRNGSTQPDFLNAYVKNPTRLQNNAFEFELSKILYGNLTMIEGYFGDSRNEKTILSGLPELYDVSALTAYESPGVFTLNQGTIHLFKDGMKKVKLSNFVASRMPTFHILQNKFVVFKNPEGQETPYLFEYGPLKYGQYSSSNRERTTTNTHFLFTSQAGGQNLHYSVIVFRGEAYIAMRPSELPSSIMARHEVEIRPVYRDNTTWSCGSRSDWGGGCRETFNIKQANSTPVQLYDLLRSEILNRGNDRLQFNVQLNLDPGVFVIRDEVGLQESEILTPESMIFLFKLKEIAVTD